jgi:hypothetical protein
MNLPIMKTLKIINKLKIPLGTLNTFNRMKIALIIRINSKIISTLKMRCILIPATNNHRKKNGTRIITFLLRRLNINTKNLNK